MLTVKTTALWLLLMAVGCPLLFISQTSKSVHQWSDRALGRLADWSTRLLLKWKRQHGLVGPARSARDDGKGGAMRA